MRRHFAILALTATALAGCGGGHSTTTPSAPAERTPGLYAQAPFADPEPTNVFAQSLGPLPGARGSNGNLTASSLAPIYNGTLARPAAASWNTLNLYTRRYHHRNVLSGGADASYRTYGRQQYWRAYWCGQGACQNAAVPGTSNHGWGRADDLNDCGATRDELDRSGPLFGWRHGEVPYECWHVTLYAPSFGHPDPGPDYNNPRLCHGSGGPGQAGFVKDVQHALSRNHLNTVASGYFTLGTVGNLKRFQAAHHLLVHTCTDKATWRALRAR